VDDSCIYYTIFGEETQYIRRVFATLAVSTSSTLSARGDREEGIREGTRVEIDKKKIRVRRMMDKAEADLNDGSAFFQLVGSEPTGHVTQRRCG